MGEGNVSQNSATNLYQIKVKELLRSIIDKLFGIHNSIRPLATEATLQDVEANTLGTMNNTSAINSKLASRIITPNMLNVPISTSGTISASVYSISFCNTSTSEDALVLGEVLKPLTTVSFDSGVLNNKYPANVFTYNSQNAELLITYNS
jgi:hypothetical protein